MVFLHDKHPGVFAGFRKGRFVVKKTTHVFSGIAIDQAHEQNNALRRWMVSGPEMARLIGEFEVSTKKRNKTDYDITSKGNMHR